MRILVADDDPIQRARLGEVLESWGHEVVAVANGEQGWQALQEDSSFSILLTDWLMPELDGPDLCRRIRAQPRDRYLPIILLTSLRRTEDLVAGLNSGADAFVTKPFDAAQLMAQIHVVERILELEERLDTQLRETKVANERLEMDLEAAAEVQVSLLPDSAPNILGVEFAWTYQACDRLGGDMFNIFRLDETHVGMYVLDVSGHGTPAALQSVSLSHAITPYDVQGGILKRRSKRDGKSRVVSPADVARKLNHQFRLIERSGQFFTFLYCVLDVITHELRYVRAGHPGPIVVSGDRAECFEKGGGIPIGILREAEYEEELIQLERGDCLVFYTDGVLEALNATGTAFGLDRLTRTLVETPGSIADRLGELEDRLEVFARGCARRDDVTVVGLRLG